MTDENGLYYMRARYYNPDIRRFINQDIKVGDIGSSQSLNRYAYCEGNPVSLVDPFGLSPESTQDQGEKSKYQFWHNVLDVAGLFFDGADIINAGLYALEGNWVQAGVSIACALPFIGTAVAGVTKATKLVKIGKAIEKTMKIAGKAYMTVQAATTALEMAGDARMEYALNGGKVTLGVVAKAAGAVFMGGVAALSAGSLIKDVTSLSKAGNIEFNTKSRQTADAESGRCAKGEGIGCFIAGTKVRTEDGEKNIEEVEAGDYVLAENPLTGEQEYKQVVQTYIHEKTTLVHVFIEDEEVITTEEHPFYVEGTGFVSAGELRCGDTVRLADGRKVPVKQVRLEYLDEPVAVYNFEVEDFHTYYVSELGVLVHNMCGEKATGATGGGADFYVVSDGVAARSLDEYDAFRSGELSQSYLTGKGGEKALAQMVGGKSQAYFKTSLGKRFVDQLENGIAHESKVGYTSLTKRIQKQIDKDAELIKLGKVDGAHWHFFTSKITGKGGASKQLLEYLSDKGINYTIH